MLQAHSDGRDALGVNAGVRTHRGATLVRKDGFGVVDCKDCGFKHVLPLPSEEELVHVYGHEYYATEKPLYLARVEEDRDWWERLHDRRLQRVEGFLPRTAQKLLDVGSGPGLLLERAQHRGWDATGIEPSHQAAEHARSLGASVCEAFLDDELAAELLRAAGDSEEGAFDCIHAAEVLEHLPDPRAMVQRMVRLLRPGGVLVLSVPNDFNPIQAALTETGGFAPWWVAPPHHLNYFDFDSLEGLLVAEGLEILHRETSFPIDLFLLMGEDYTGDDETGRTCHRRRMKLEAALHEAGRGQLLDDLYSAFAELGIGRHAVVYGRLARARSGSGEAIERVS